MSQPIINLPKRDWKTYYDPKLVGAYLVWFDKENKIGKPGELIEMRAGSFYPQPVQPYLEDFLKWVAKPKQKGK